MIGHVTRAVAESSGRGMGEDDRSSADVQGVLHGPYRHVWQVNHHPQPVHLTNHALHTTHNTSVLWQTLSTWFEYQWVKFNIMLNHNYSVSPFSFSNFPRKYSLFKISEKKNRQCKNFLQTNKTVNCLRNFLKIKKILKLNLKMF